MDDRDTQFLALPRHEQDTRLARALELLERGNPGCSWYLGMLRAIYYERGREDALHDYLAGMEPQGDA